MREAQIFRSRPETAKTDGAIIIPGWTRRQEFYLILLLAIGVRLIGFNDPLTSQNWVKQLQIAPIAKNFAEKSLNILWPETDYSADQPGYIEIEFQLVTWLTGILWRVFGIHEFLARLVVLLFSIGSLLIFNKLVSLHLSKQSAFYAFLVFCFLPTNWYFSHVLMSEPVMLCLSLGLIYTFYLWIESGDIKHYIVAAIAGALCFLVKLPAVMLVIPLVYLAWHKYDRKLFAQPMLYLFALLTLAPAAGYYLHAHNIGLKYFTVGVDFSGGMWFNLENFTKPGNWSLMFDRFVRQHLTAIGMVLLPLGIFTIDPETKKIRYNLFHVWLGTVLLYFFIVSGGNLRQNYYQIHIIPPAAALIGIGWTQLLNCQRFSKAFNAVLLPMFLGLCVWGVEPMYQSFEPIHKAVKELNTIDKAKQPVIVMPPGYGCLFYFDRPGWCGREHMGKRQELVPDYDIPGPEYFQNRIDRGARWAVYFFAPDLPEAPEIEEYLRVTHKLVSEVKGEYLIFDLSQTKAGQPFNVEVSIKSQDKPISFLWDGSDTSAASNAINDTTTGVTDTQ